MNRATGIITRPLFRRLKAALPAISDTERQALEAGDVWWDAQLLSGTPDWSYLLQTVGPYRLSPEEQAFIDGPVEELCSMIDDWEINFEQRRVTDDLWEFIREQRFFGMIIPKEYGGLGFSAAAHSEVVARIGSRSAAVAVTVMVPNSLGPGELLLKYGTQAQKEHYLPRLADGRDIPCFGLTSPEAGSDASAMTDSGVVCRGQWQGEDIVGIRLNWHKRYITLGPVATLLGLAFRLYDPDGLLGGERDLGITLALVPTHLPGIDIGKRHWPSMQAFQNGPNWGHDVFVPLDAIIGGREQIGRGWMMLMSALAAGRSISLPALSAGSTKLAARSTGAYARIREQFGLPIAKFEGVQARLARLAGSAYLVEAARRVTTLAVDAGHNPAVVSAIVKSQLTYRARQALIDAMDVHGGKTVCDGPSNYLGNLYRAQPVAITVEGANILTRNLIVFGQGAIRCHPYLLEEIFAAEADDDAGLDKFDGLIVRHLRYTGASIVRAFVRALTGGRPGATPPTTRPVVRFYRQLNRYAAALSFVTEVALLHLGGTLKRKEMISARLGDVLSELYLLSCVLKRYHSEGEPELDLPLVSWCCESGFQTIERRFDEAFSNYPNRAVALLLRGVVFPLGRHRHGPSDSLLRTCAELLTSPNEARDRLTAGIFLGNEGDGLARVERAFDLVDECAPLRLRMKEKGVESVEAAHEAGLIDETERRLLLAADEAVASAIAVDFFEPEVLSPAQQPKEQPPSTLAASGRS